jgi:hypothetical protein
MTDLVSEVNLQIHGNPVGKGRPKFSSKNGRVYTPKQTVLAEREIRQAWREEGEPRLPDVALEMRVDLYVQRPQGHFKKNGELSTEGNRHPVPKNKKPDVDNALKLVMDALNSRAYKDDVQVAKVILVRHWGEWPKTEISIKEYLPSE